MLISHRHIHTPPITTTASDTPTTETLPWKRVHEYDSMDSHPAELDPARTLTSHPAITLNDDSVEESPQKSPLSIDIPHEPWVNDTYYKSIINNIFVIY